MSSETGDVAIRTMDLGDCAFGGEYLMDLRHPERKMSKSEPGSCLFLDDEDYKRKIMRAVINEAGRANLENIYNLLGGTGDLSSMDNKTLKEQIIELYERIMCDV